MRSMLDAALELAGNGWAVLPCREVDHPMSPEMKAKAPYLRRGFKEASTDPNQIQAWWRRWPDAMIGAPVPASLLVLDIDPRNGGSLAALEDVLGALPATGTAWSGRGDGGRHLYYRRPAGPISAHRLPDGVDLKVSGYCIVPPSLHPSSGEPYAWDGSEFAYLPARARIALQPKPRSAPRVLIPHGTGGGEHLVRFVAGFTTHGVNDALYWAAHRAVENNVLDKIADDLVQAAVSVGESERQARATVDSARKRAGAA